jgi:uncharacterized membrane protein
LSGLNPGRWHGRFIAVWLLLKVALWAAIFSLIVCGIRRLRHERHLASPMPPLQILKARYARGELSKQDFESMRHDIDG